MNVLSWVVTNKLYACADFLSFKSVTAFNTLPSKVFLLHLIFEVLIKED